jgi:hypothetical protein
MAQLLRIILSAVSAIIMGWAAYGIASWGLSYTSLTTLNRAAMSAVASLIFIGSLWMADLWSFFRDRPPKPNTDSG